MFITFYLNFIYFILNKINKTFLRKIQIKSNYIILDILCYMHFIFLRKHKF